jgi:hypothetical protein
MLMQCSAGKLDSHKRSEKGLSLSLSLSLNGPRIVNAHNTFNKKLIINHALLRRPEASRILKAILAVHVGVLLRGLVRS